jgi:cysteinyl-tRNA synthetase
LAFRLFCFGAKYRSELAFSLDAVRAAEKNLYYLWNVTRLVHAGEADSSWTYQYQERFGQALADDLNTPQALAITLELVHEAHKRADFRIWNTLKKLDEVLGIRLEEQFQAVDQAVFPPQVSKLIRERAQARERKDFKLSDKLRDEITALGYNVFDSKNGPSRYSPRW